MERERRRGSARERAKIFRALLRILRFLCQGGSASKARGAVLPGDRIVAVEGVSCQGMGLDQVIEQISSVDTPNLTLSLSRDASILAVLFDGMSLSLSLFPSLSLSLFVSLALSLSPSPPQTHTRKASILAVLFGDRSLSLSLSLSPSLPLSLSHSHSHSHSHTTPVFEQCSLTV